MNFTNINDPAGVKSLLEQLRSSQAWQDVVNQQQPAADQESSSSVTQPSVASLLSQLQSTPSPSKHPHPNQTGETVPERSAQTRSPNDQQSAVSSRDRRQRQDIRSLTYQQSLPILAQLSEDEKFLQALRDLKKKQDDLEQQLHKERLAIRQKYEEKVKVAKTKANMIGAEITKHEADMLSDGYRKELANFDKERALGAWDALIFTQQEALARLGVPTMFKSDVKTDRERQLRVMKAMEGMV